MRYRVFIVFWIVHTYKQRMVRSMANGEQPLPGTRRIFCSWSRSREQHTLKIWFEREAKRKCRSSSTVANLLGSSAVCFWIFQLTLWREMRCRRPPEIVLPWIRLASTSSSLNSSGCTSCWTAVTLRASHLYCIWTGASESSSSSFYARLAKGKHTDSFANKNILTIEVTWYSPFCW